MATKDVRLDTVHRHAELHGKKGTKPGGVQDACLSNDPGLWKPGGLERKVSHCIKWVVDHQQHAVWRVFDNLGDVVGHNLLVDEEKVIAAHTGFPGCARCEDHDIAVCRERVISRQRRSCDLAVVTDDRAGFGEVKRLAL